MRPRQHGRDPGGPLPDGLERFYAEEAPVRDVGGRVFSDRRRARDRRALPALPRAHRLRHGRRARPAAADYPARPRPTGSRLGWSSSPRAAPVALDDGEPLVGLCLGRRLAPPRGPGSDNSHAPDHPVNHVAFADAVRVRRLGGQSALATEAEWECAARGGMDGAVFAWGDAERPGGGCWPTPGRASSRGKPVPSSGGAPRRSGCSRANGYGLYDVTGQRVGMDERYYSPRRRRYGGARQAVLRPADETRLRPLGRRAATSAAPARTSLGA